MFGRSKAGLLSGRVVSIEAERISPDSKKISQLNFIFMQAELNLPICQARKQVWEWFHKHKTGSRNNSQKGAFADRSPASSFGFMATSARHFIYVHCHDLGRWLGAYGAGGGTPRLDAFAQESFVWEQAYCASAACTPSRACALTGKYAHQTGCIGLSHMGWPLDLAQKTIVDDLNEAGFKTVLSGVNHERHPRTDRYEVDLTEDWGHWRAGVAVDRALAYVQGHDRRQRLFLNVGMMEPHPSTWRHFEPEKGDQVWLPTGYPDNPVMRVHWGRFQAARRAMDAAFGRLLGGLESCGLTRDALIVFTTDHGLPGPRSKGSVYLHGLETSLMVRLPGQISGHRIAVPVSNAQNRATWRDLLGLPTSPEEQLGSSFAHLMTDSSPIRAKPGWIFAERNFHGERMAGANEEFADYYDPQRSIFDGRYHLIWNTQPGRRARTPTVAEPSVWSVNEESGFEACWPDDAGSRTEWELYDTHYDRLEFVNLVERPELGRQRKLMQEALVDWMEHTGDFLPGMPPSRPEEPGWGDHWPVTVSS